jgi:hypothetical protein
MRKRRPSRGEGGSEHRPGSEGDGPGKRRAGSIAVAGFSTLSSAFADRSVLPG